MFVLGTTRELAQPPSAATGGSERVPLSVLFVEDSSDDAELEVAKLRSAGYDVSYARVDTSDALRAALASRQWDLVISDFSMPQLTGLEALRMVREFSLDLPFILVSGTLGEDAAVNAIKAGADEYVLKDKLSRLEQAVTRGLRAAHARRAMRRTRFEQELFARSSERLSESIDYGVTLSRAAEIALPEFADWCALDVLEEDRILRRAAFAHTDPRRHELGVHMAARYPCEATATRVARTGRSEVVTHVTDGFLTTLTDGLAHAEFLRELGIESFLVAPLRARGQSLGAMTFVSTRPERRYDRTDVPLGEELARRAAIAIDNARLYKKAQEAIRVRDDFLSIASHELRTPITSLQLLLQGLTSGLTTGPDDEQTSLLISRGERARRSIERLTALVESLLDVSRISSGAMKLTLEPTDLCQLARDVADRFREQAGRAGCSLHVEAGDSATGLWDRVRLDQVLTNLLSNAIKYGAGRPVRVVVTPLAGSTRVQVIDAGIGIPKEALTRIFGRFERAVPAQHYGGLGLGLYISQRIVEAHGGTISASSEPGSGATFSFVLPNRPHRTYSNPHPD